MKDIVDVRNTLFLECPSEIMINRIQKRASET
jgi:hypothetical protein